MQTPKKAVKIASTDSAFLTPWLVRSFRLLRVKLFACRPEETINSTLLTVYNER